MCFFVYLKQVRNVHMTVDKAVNVLVKAGLLDQADAPTATATLAYPSIEMTYPAWA